MIDFTALNAAVADAQKQVTDSTTVESSATALINTFSAAIAKAVADAIAADDAADQGTADSVAAAISQVTSQFNASAAALGAAVVANTPPVPSQAAQRSK